MKRLFRRYLPTPQSLREHRLLRHLGHSVMAPALWHINHRTVAGGVAVGMFCGLIPGPLQMLAAALACMALRLNLPLALLTTFYTNPFTIVPLYLLAFGIGRALSGSDAQFVLPPQRGDTPWLDWCQALIDWFISLGQPLLIGLPVLATALALLAWLIIHLAWRASLWHKRRNRQSPNRIG